MTGILFLTNSTLSINTTAAILNADMQALMHRRRNTARSYLRARNTSKQKPNGLRVVRENALIITGTAKKFKKIFRNESLTGYRYLARCCNKRTCLDIGVQCNRLYDRGKEVSGMGSEILLRIKNIRLHNERKVLIGPRLRRIIPPHFTWVDHRLVREGYIKRCSIKALGLYLFLLAVSDAEGLSYYGYKRVSQELGISEDSVSELRRELISARLIAHKDGIYQLLEFDKFKDEKESTFTGACKASDVVAMLLGGVKNG